MKTAYPVILTPDEPGYIVYIPDLNINTEGYDLADALYMAKDAIEQWGVATEDLGQQIPSPSVTLPECKEGEIACFVWVDFEACRKADERRAVRKNVSLPSYLNDAAEKAGLNFSRLLQDAIKEKLGIA